MSKLDLAKEQIAYLKFWLGVLAAIAISIISWLLTNIFTAETVLIIAALICLVIITKSGFDIHQSIERKINELENL